MRILASVDGSAASLLAARYAAEVAATNGSLVLARGAPGHANHGGRGGE